MLPPAAREGTVRPRWRWLRSPPSAAPWPGLVLIPAVLQAAVLLATVLLLLAVHAPVAAQASGCAGDCNGNGHVTVDELVTLARIALGVAPLSACHPGDTNSDGRITVDEIVAAVNADLRGCPSGTPNDRVEMSTSGLLGSMKGINATDQLQIVITDFGCVGASGCGPAAALQSSTAARRQAQAAQSVPLACPDGGNLLRWR